MTKAQKLEQFDAILKDKNRHHVATWRHSDGGYAIGQRWL